VAALDQMRTPDATAALRELAAGHPQAPLTAAAARALRRAEPAARTPR
jgi:hypothetical protein